MKLNNDSNEKQATKDDDRITKIGSILRRTSLDEFPQFINVFKGEMSVVGPRPHMLKHTAMYGEVVNKFMVRHLAKPGITGWAQIKGFRGETKEVEDMVNSEDMNNAECILCGTCVDGCTQGAILYKWST